MNNKSITVILLFVALNSYSMHPRTPLTQDRDPFVRSTATASDQTTAYDLSDYALNELSFLGTLTYRAKPIAIIATPNGSVYHVAAGHTIAREQAKIAAISNTDIHLYAASLPITISMDSATTSATPQ